MKENQQKTLYELLQECEEKQQQEITHIPTFNQSLDEVLQGGIPLGEVSQIVGFPGIGKSQLSMQLCCNYQWIENQENNNLNECIYFDSGYNCSGKRLEEMISSLLSSNTNETETENQNDLNEIQTKRIKQILKKISIQYPNDLIALLANIIALERESKTIKLIIIDSITTFFKKTTYETNIKLQTIQTLMQHLSSLAQKKNCAIVIVNHLTTKEIERNYTAISFDKKNEYSFSFTKTLGVSFSCYIHLTFYLFQLPDQTEIIVHSSDSFINHRIPFTITQHGFM